MLLKLLKAIINFFKKLFGGFSAIKPTDKVPSSVVTYYGGYGYAKK